MPLPEVDLSALPSEYGAAVKAVRAKVPAALARPAWGIICGSGLSGLAGSLKDKVEIPYEQIPGFPNSTVHGHKSILALGFLEQGDKRVPVVACLGRFHMYEGHSPQDCVFPTRLFRCLGTQAIVVTNAAGGINPNFEVGTIVAMHDHLSLPCLTDKNPLIGHNLDAFGSRFPPLSNAYDIPLRLALFRAANALNLSAKDMQQGTYAHVSGPTYESRAECRFLRSIGGDCVGMSTVPEVIAAHHAGMRVLAISLITNKVVVDDYLDARKALQDQANGGDALGKKTADADTAAAANHEEVLEVGKRRAEDIRKLVETVICQTDLD
ncbi:inosine guanosine and [Tilletiaria anomala UBC 951]|uniref:Purine nucleoside phosphorylase n=1 Tax=Tilletiaria anomala (strain ATCC 24038 / CBS 436.72 / UBC 951) TaxID=1037660 RepID=A0A066VYR2_TILAU|nr:inosine guanosine and [Tilletiaria anomala UBC 951]KDN43690.1 inosine guanosine and [Tilletiaria anomala UBC 951]